MVPRREEDAYGTVRQAQARYIYTRVPLAGCPAPRGMRRATCYNTEASQRVFHQWHVMPRHHGGDVGRRLVTRRCRRRRRDEDEDLGLGEGRAARSVLQRPAQIGHRRPVASGRGGAIDAAA